MDLIAIVEQLKAERDRLDRAIAALDGSGATEARSGTSRNGRKKRRTMSAAARRKIAAAQRARWAKVRQEAKAKKTG